MNFRPEDALQAHFDSRLQPLGDTIHGANRPDDVVARSARGFVVGGSRTGVNPRGLA